MPTLQSYDSVESGATAPPELAKLIVHEQGNTAVSARELHRYVESSERFSKWIDRMFEYGFENGVDYTPYQKVHPLNKQTFGDFALTLDTAKEIAMVQRNEKGRQARRFFIECEKKLRSLVQNSQTGLIQLINDQTAKLILLERKIDSMKRDHVKAFKARVAERHRHEQIKKTDADRELRDKSMEIFGQYLKRSAYNSWGELWRTLHVDYAIDISAYTRYQGEHLMDVALRVGRIKQVYELISYKYDR